MKSGTDRGSGGLIKLLAWWKVDLELYSQGKLGVDSCQIWSARTFDYRY